VTFDCDPRQHVADWHEHRRLLRIERARIRALAAGQWRDLPDYVHPKEAARQHLAAMPAARRAELEAGWSL
jgi:hypothetical protein